MPSAGPKCDLPHITARALGLHSRARQRVERLLLCPYANASVAKQRCPYMADATLPQDPPPAAASFTQEHRLLAIDTPLGKDKLLLTRLAGEEEISKPFSFDVTTFSDDPEIAPESLIGRKV